MGASLLAPAKSIYYKSQHTIRTTANGHLLTTAATKTRPKLPK